MDAVQNFILLILFIPVVYVVVKGYYAEQKRAKVAAKRKLDNESMIQHYEQMSKPELNAVLEVAATSESTTMQTVEDFIELVNNPLTIGNLYDIALANFIRLSPSVKQQMYTVDESGDENLQDATILQALEDEGLVSIHDDNRPHLTIKYAVKLYLRMMGYEDVDSDEAKIRAKYLTSIASEAFEKEVV